MNLYLKAVLCALLLVAACTAPTARRAHTWLDAAKVTVKIVSPEGTGGTGFPVGYMPTFDGPTVVLILTAAHVVRDEDLTDWSVMVADERWLGVPKLVQYHRSLDAAIVQVRIVGGRPIRIVRLREAEAEIGEQVWAIGYPGCHRRTITTGYVGQRGAAGIDVFPGNSGGPVVDGRGRAVGIVLGVGVQSIWGPLNPVLIQHDMVFLPTTDILEWVDRWLNL